MLWFKSLEEKIAGLRARQAELRNLAIQYNVMDDSYYVEESLKMSQRIAELECRKARKYTPAPWLKAVE